jgi:hypothetical protein
MRVRRWVIDCVVKVFDSQFLSFVNHLVNKLSQSRFNVRQYVILDFLIQFLLSNNCAIDPKKIS